MYLSNSQPSLHGKKQDQQNSNRGTQLDRLAPMMILATPDAVWGAQAIQEIITTHTHTHTHTHTLLTPNTITFVSAQLALYGKLCMLNVSQ